MALELQNQECFMKSVKFMFLAALAASSLSAFAGPNDSGGGKAVVCKHWYGTVKSVELLDLWEARELYDRNIVHSSASIGTQIKEAAARLKNVIVYPYVQTHRDSSGVVIGSLRGGDALESELVQGAFTIAGVPLEVGTGLEVKRKHRINFTLTPDSFEDALPDKCEIKQVVQYKDSGPVAFVNQDLVDRMDITNQVALALHEALYAEMRKLGEKTSIRVRRAIGYVMSGGSFKPLDDFLKGPHITCESIRREAFSGDGYATRIHYFKQTNGLLTLMPEKIGGIFMMGFEEHNGSGSPYSPEEMYQKILEGGIGFGAGIPTSPVDFDLEMVVDSRNGEQILKLTRTASGASVPFTDKLHCSLVN
jgi:hypothetical protein